MNRVKLLLILQVLLCVYSFFGIFSKMAASETFMSLKFILFYGIVLLNLVIYAIVWQQIIKRMPLVVAYCNKAVTVIWGLIWGKLFFGEAITMQKIVGAGVIVMGILLIVTDCEAEND
jgi:drug/metabolite transporter (DMT)-like permease